jgi:hypothetical protein
MKNQKVRISSTLVWAFSLVTIVTIGASASIQRASAGDDVAPMGKCDTRITTDKGQDLSIYVAQITRSDCFEGAANNATINKAKKVTVKFEINKQ